VVGAVLSLGTVIWYGVDRYRAAQDVKVAPAVQQMSTAMKDVADAVQVAAVSQPTQALRDAVSAVSGARAALDSATVKVIRR
jgi:hypothetical protein